MVLEDTECSICLQKFVHPVKLPCGHIFCFLCVKGCSFHRRRCPICRGRFSQRFFDDPQLLPETELVSSEEATSTQPQATPHSPTYRWFYEGYAGWWQYDERTSDDLEEAYSKKLSSLDVIVAGHVYTIDLTAMTQIRKDHPGRRRRIKRDLSTCEKKGIAGIKLTSLQPLESTSQIQHSGSTNSSSSTSNQPSPARTTSSHRSVSLSQYSSSSSTNNQPSPPRTTPARSRNSHQSASVSQHTQATVQTSSSAGTTAVPMTTRSRSRHVPTRDSNSHPRSSRSLSNSRFRST